MAIAVKRYKKADIVAFCSCPILLDFFYVWAWNSKKLTIFRITEVRIIWRIPLLLFSEAYWNPVEHIRRSFLQTKLTANNFRKNLRCLFDWVLNAPLVLALLDINSEHVEHINVVFQTLTFDKKLFGLWANLTQVTCKLL